MACKRLGILVSVFMTILFATALPALAYPCSTIQTNCINQCYYAGSTCMTWGVGQCTNGLAPWSFTCANQGPVTGYCSCSGGGSGCFLSGAPITMADGSTKPIEEIRVGDMVLAYDEATKQMKPDKVKVVHPAVERDFYLVVNGSMRLTPNHRVLSKNEWVEIGQLAVGDTLTAPDGKAVPIEKIERVDEKVTVYNFAVNPYETYVANGVIVHNKKEE